jgi:hypothetical protein
VPNPLAIFAAGEVRGWWDADPTRLTKVGDDITQRDDRSTYGHDVTQGVAARAPHSGATFGGNSTPSIQWGNYASSDHWLEIASNADLQHGNNSHLFAFAIKASSLHDGVPYSKIDDFTMNFGSSGIFNLSVGGVNAISVTTTYSAGEEMILLAVHQQNAGEVWYYKNGTTAEKISKATNSNTGTNELCHGVYKVTETNYQFDGIDAEILHVTRAAASGDFSQAEAESTLTYFNSVHSVY